MLFWMKEWSNRLNTAEMCTQGLAKAKSLEPCCRQFGWNGDVEVRSEGPSTDWGQGGRRDGDSSHT